MTTKRDRLLGLLAVAMAVAGCGSSSGGSTQSQTAVNPNSKEVSPPGDIPDNQAFVAYSPAGGGYSVKVPEGWAQTKAGGATTFTDKLNSVRIESQPAVPPATVAGYRSKEEPKLAKSVNGFQAVSVAPVSRKGGKAIRAVYYAQSQPDQVTGKITTDTVERYEFFKSGTRVVLTLSGPKGADNVDPWRIVSDSLRFTQ